jgi:hypothetical protein
MTFNYPQKSISSVQSNEELANRLSQIGFDVIPVDPDTLNLTVPYEEWITSSRPSKVPRHWTSHPSDAVSICFGYTLYALRTSGDNAYRLMADLETKHGIYSLVDVHTDKECWHFFSVPDGVGVEREHQIAEMQPDSFRVVTPGELLKAPGSPGTLIKKWDIEYVCDLEPVTQEFVDEARLIAASQTSELVRCAEAKSCGGIDDSPAPEQLLTTSASAGHTVRIKLELQVKQSDESRNSSDPVQRLECEVVWS